MSTFRTRAVRLLVGAFSFLTVALLLLALYCYLDYQRLKQERVYPTPEDAFLDVRSSEKVTIESSRRCFVLIAGRKVLPIADLWFVTGRHSIDGGEKPFGTLFFRIDGGWVRVSEASPTPLVVCAARRVRLELQRLFGS